MSTREGLYGGPMFRGAAADRSLEEELGWQNSSPLRKDENESVAEMVSKPSPLPRNEGGKKYDAGKAMAGLMMRDFAKALAAVADVTTFGATKYTPGGWVNVPDAERRYTDALYRHLLAHAAGQTHDAESGLPHLAHAAWNVLALLEMETRGWHDDV